MAAVSPVDYFKPSSSSDINSKFDDDKNGIPEKVPFDESTKNAIYKDAGKNVNLSAVQQAWIDDNVNPDEVKYSSEEAKDNGSSAIDTTGEDGENLSDKNKKNNAGAVAATAGTTIGGAAGLFFAIKLFTELAKMPGQSARLTGFGQLILAIAAIAGGAGAILAVTAFDPEKNERKAQTDASEANNETIATYTRALEDQSIAMGEDFMNYSDASEEYVNDTSDKIITRGIIEAQIAEANAQGNMGRVGELQQELKGIEGELQEPSEAQEEMETYKSNLETYGSYNNEAIGVKESGTTVSNFLKPGNSLKTMAEINMYALYACSLASLAALAACFPKLAFGIDLGASLGAKIAFGAAAALFYKAGEKMGGVGDLEGAAGVAGDKMGDKVGELEATIDDNQSTIGDCAGGYAEADAGAAETLTTTQGAVDGANAKLGENLGNGQGDDEGDDEGGNENPPA